MKIIYTLLFFLSCVEISHAQTMGEKYGEMKAVTLNEFPTQKVEYIYVKKLPPRDIVDGCRLLSISDRRILKTPQRNPIYLEMMRGGMIVINENEFYMTGSRNQPLYFIDGVKQRNPGSEFHIIPNGKAAN